MGYLHIGQNVMLEDRRIIGIFDLDKTTESKITRTFLNKAEEEGVVLTAVEDIPKSFILYKENGKYMICFSQISTSALIGRAEGGEVNQLRNYNLQE